MRSSYRPILASIGSIDLNSSHNVKPARGTGGIGIVDSINFHPSQSSGKHRNRRPKVGPILGNAYVILNGRIGKAVISRIFYIYLIYLTSLIIPANRSIGRNGKYILAGCRLSNIYIPSYGKVSRGYTCICIDFTIYLDLGLIHYHIIRDSPIIICAA